MTNQTTLHQDKETMLSQSEVDHIVARKVMQHRQDEFEKGLMSLSNQVKDSNADVRASLRGIEDSLVRQYSHVTDCRDDMEREIEDKFFTKDAAKSMEDRIESKIQISHQALSSQIKLNGSKLAWTMGGIGIAITIGQIMFSVVRYG